MLDLDFGGPDGAHVDEAPHGWVDRDTVRGERLMAFELPDSWVWDFWVVDDGEQYHLFFLFASRALQDPDLRHHRASIGHAVSADLRSWRRVADALVRSDPPEFDDLATWTGSVVRHRDGRWLMFYTGASLNKDGANVQSIGCASSLDLMTWVKCPAPAPAGGPPVVRDLRLGRELARRGISRPVGLP